MLEYQNLWDDYSYCQHYQNSLPWINIDKLEQIRTGLQASDEMEVYQNNTQQDYITQ